jgi:hypothetical protein
MATLHDLYITAAKKYDGTFSAVEIEKKRLEICLVDETFRKEFAVFAREILCLEMCCDTPDFTHITYWPTRAAVVRNRADFGFTTETGDIITTLFHALYYDGETNKHYGFRAEHCLYADGTVDYDFEVVFHDDECDGEGCNTYRCPSYTN